jgi:hypothetical protein
MVPNLHRDHFGPVTKVGRHFYLYSARRVIVRFSHEFCLFLGMISQTTETVRGTILLVVGAAALIWFIVRTVRGAEDPARMAFKWILTIPLALLCLFSFKLFGPYGLFVIVGSGVVLSILWTPHLGAALIEPLTGILDGGNQQIEPRPAYSIAQSRQKQGRYTEAVAEIRKQLARFPTDFEGQMMLAQILAENLQDLPGAELTIQKLCEQPGHAPKNIAFALYALADWHLKIGQDAEAARRALQAVIDAFPESEFSLGAAQRIAHLGGTDMLMAPYEQKKFHVVEGPRDLGLQRARAGRLPAQTDPAEQAAHLVKHLEEHPLDTEAREKLAVLYLDHYARLDLATDQLEQMIQQPNQPAKLVVRWLNLLADLQIRSGADHATVHQTLQRIIDRNPNLAAAEIARNRQALVKLELKANEKREGVKLGTYEQNIGLKRGGAPRLPQS